MIRPAARGYRVLRLYFFGQVQAALPFRMRRLQTDDGDEFSLAFNGSGRRGWSIGHYNGERSP